MLFVSTKLYSSVSWYIFSNLIKNGILNNEVNITLNRLYDAGWVYHHSL